MAVTEIMVISGDYQNLIADDESALPQSRAILVRQEKPAYLAGMLHLDLLRWLEDKPWDVKVGGWFFVFKFERTSDAVLFKLTWL